MSNRNKGKYFTVADLKKIEKGCNYLILIGERANGKSYAVKQHLLQQAFKNIDGKICNKEFAYIRRFDLECKDSVVEPYFSDMPISSITDGMYSMISVYRKRIYFANMDDDGKVVRGVCIGHCFALASAEHYKSLMYPRIFNILMEEIVSQNNQYVFHESFAFQQLVSTILRDRKGMVYMIGNTLSRMCPYYSEWGLNAENLEQGECNIIHHDNVVIKVFRTRSRNYDSGMFFGLPGKNITKGEYYTEEKPHLIGKLKDYEITYTCVLVHDKFKFLMRLLKNNKGERFWYIEPKTSEVQDNTRVISNHFNPSVMWTNGFLPFTKNEDIAFKILLNHHKACYSDNLTGTEFESILDYYD